LSRGPHLDALHGLNGSLQQFAAKKVAAAKDDPAVLFAQNPAAAEIFEYILNFGHGLPRNARSAPTVFQLAANDRNRFHFGKLKRKLECGNQGVRGEGEQYCPQASPKPNNEAANQIVDFLHA
jgi:hypothetical protein